MNHWGLSEVDTIISAVGMMGDLAGVLIIAIGLIVVTLRFFRALAINEATAYTGYRSGIGRTLLLGLEFLVAADIIRTVATTPTFTSVGVLAAIVAIRTFLSWSLQLEIEGRWPWQARTTKQDGNA
ncbi:MAG: DUF1622 domain-containing protein [Beijerinckiaceae bacterium]|nr:DUF1622 domain-containing protein [Beijerinckiaceae bacterium]